MKYFAKHLPDTSEIKVGDKIRSESSGRNPVTVTAINENGDYVTDELDFHEYIDTWYFIVRKDKAVKVGKLFLCSRDIKVKDVLDIDGDGGKVFGIDPYFVYMRRKDGTETYRSINDCYKPIGEISPDALGYVREGQEYEREDWKYEENDRKNYNELNIKIKGPCGHFH